VKVRLNKRVWKGLFHEDYLTFTSDMFQYKDPGILMSCYFYW